MSKVASHCITQQSYVAGKIILSNINILSNPKICVLCIFWIFYVIIFNCGNGVSQLASLLALDHACVTPKEKLDMPAHHR